VVDRLESLRDGRAASQNMSSPLLIVISLAVTKCRVKEGRGVRFGASKSTNFSKMLSHKRYVSIRT